MNTGNLKAWIALSRPAFHSVGVLPYVLGGVVARRVAGVFDWPVFLTGALGVVLVMLATYHAGEYWDFQEDSLSRGKSRYAGGSGILQKRLLPRSAARVASIVSLCCAFIVGAILQFLLRTGPWTLGFGLLGILGGFFYSTRPLRWVSTGFGEIWIALCYGWLPVAAGYYIQTGTLVPCVHWLAIPIGLTIFNVILLNEYPDRDADRAARKMNVLARVGPRVGACIYSCTAALGSMAFIFSVYRGIDRRALILYAPVVLASSIVVWHMLTGRWENDQVLERMCAFTILINLATTAVYIITFLWLVTE